MTAQPAVTYLSDPAFFQEKEAAYLRARRAEGRLLSDEAVKQLPLVSSPITFSPSKQEWHWRSQSFQRFRHFLLKKHAQRPLRILDLGCGNGWMANQLAKQKNWDIWAVDLNETELEQGARCFLRSNLRFVYADVLAGVLPQNHFDVAVLAAAAQYFPDLPALCAALRKCLTVNGEIHVLDTHFYPDEAARTAARQRSADYYARLGVPEMTAFYWHHLWADAAALGAENLNRDRLTWLLQKVKWLAPFPWMRVSFSQKFESSEQSPSRRVLVGNAEAQSKHLRRKKEN